MALNLYSGRPGSGKSYSVVAHVVIPALKKGRHIVTNIPLEVDELTTVFGGEITQLPLDALDDPDLPSKIPNGVVAIIDECWNRWPSGQRIAKAPKNDLHWLKEHRHRVDEKGNAMQVVLVTQDPSDLASWVRKLITHTFYSTKLDTVGADNSFTINIYKGCPTGENIPKRFLIRSAFGSYDPYIYQFYKSATQSETLDVGDEKAIDKRNSIWQDPKLWFQLIGSPVVFVIAAVVLYKTAVGQSASDEPVADSDVATQVDFADVNPDPPTLHLPLQSPAPVPVDPPAQPVEAMQASAVWRIAGYIDRSAEPADHQWASEAGYGVQSSVKPLRLREPMAILQSYSGTRYVPLSQCDRYPDGINYSCDIDGARVTPWSGQMGISENVPGAAVSGARAAGVEQSEIPAARTPQPPAATTQAPAHVSSQPVIVSSGKPGHLW